MKISPSFKVGLRPHQGEINTKELKIMFSAQHDYEYKKDSSTAFWCHQKLTVFDEGT